MLWRGWGPFSLWIKFWGTKGGYSPGGDGLHTSLYVLTGSHRERKGGKVVRNKWMENKAIAMVWRCVLTYIFVERNNWVIKSIWLQEVLHVSTISHFKPLLNVILWKTYYCKSNIASCWCTTGLILCLPVITGIFDSSYICYIVNVFFIFRSVLGPINLQRTTERPKPSVLT